MKYIRTTDGIYEYGPNGHKNPPHYCVLNYDGTKLLTKEGLGEYPVEEHTIINQADTIEELCDEFVIVNNADKLPYRMNKDILNERFYATGYYYFDYVIERFEQLKNFIGTKEKHDKYADYLYEENPNYQFEGCVYGAIWTEKGLIYVARLNEKKELELL